MTVQKFIDYMQEKPLKSEGMFYWSSQILHEPPFDQLLSNFNRPPPFRASDDFLTKWRGLRFMAPSLLQFIFYFRWLFMGPAGSYSRLHVDPAGSAAWNACLEGSKRFVFFEPSVMHDLHEDLSNPAACRHLFPEYVVDPKLIYHNGLEIVASAGDVVYAPPGGPISSRIWRHRCLSQRTLSGDIRISILSLMKRLEAQKVSSSMHQAPQFRHAR